MAERQRSSLIRSKVNPPRIAADLVGRSRLSERLERGHRLALSLVSAPAGYGKSTLVASWLETADHPYAWLSLDEADGDLSLFVEYFVAAVRRLEPGACAETLTLAAGPEPRPAALASCLVNELEELKDPLVLVLDDFHRIRGTAVPELMSQLLRYPPRPLHLVILARFDPPLPLASLARTAACNAPASCSLSWRRVSRRSTTSGSWSKSLPSRPCWRIAGATSRAPSTRCTAASSWRIRAASSGRWSTSDPTF